MSLLAALVEAPYDPAAELTLPAGLGQGRAVYGGYIGALAVAAMASKVRPDRPLRSLHIDLVEPLSPGPVEVVAEPLRAGRYVEHASATVRQHGRLAALATGIFGAARASTLQVVSPAPPEMVPPETLPEFPYIEGVIPEFTQQLDYRWAVGGYPYSAHPEALVGGWCRIRGLRRPMDVVGLIALLDAWPVPLLARADRPLPASTLSWTVYLGPTLPQPQHGASDWWRFVARSALAQEGYADMSGELWDRAGVLVARTHQSVAVFG